MFKSNLKIALRHMLKYKTYSFINILGLAVGLACTLFIFLWVSDEWKFDKFHENDSRLYQIIQNQYQANGVMTFEGTVGLMAETLVKEMPEVEYAAQVAPAKWFAESGDFTISLGNKNIKSSGQFAGKDFFNIFSFNLVQGDADQVLKDKNTMVISKELALKLFNTTQNIIGQALEWHLGTFSGQAYVSGVFEGTPYNSTQQFDLVLSFEIFKDINPGVKDWGNFGTNAYVLLHKNQDIDQFNKKISNVIKERRPRDEIIPFARKYSDGYLFGKYENGQQSGGRIEYVRLFSVISLFILVIACINFMNLSTAKASRRLKEVGVRKTIGAGRKALILQYLGESMFMTCLSLLLAVLLVELLMPQFNSLTGKQLTLNWIELIVPFLSIGLLTGLLAGSYPALYLSGFKPAAILKGKIGISSGEVWARNGLVVFQFIISVCLIVSVLVVYKQVEFVQTKNLGYDKDNVIQFVNESKAAERSFEFVSLIKQIPGVINASCIQQNITSSSKASTVGLSWEGKDPDAIVQFMNMTVGYDAIETLGLGIKEGRSFSREFGADKDKIIFNEAAVRTMGLEQPVGKTINLWGTKRQIIGVVKDFNLETLHQTIKPAFLKLGDDHMRTSLVKISAGREKEVIKKISELYESYNPGYVLNYSFLDQDYQAQYLAEQRVAMLSRYFAGLAILISCLGLFGMAAFSAERRLKEIGIRKVLGSGVLAIITLLSTDFIRMVFWAIVIAMPLSYLMARNWLDDFAYHIDLQAWYFISAGLVTLLIALFTVSTQALKAANTNLVKCLRDE